MKTELTDVALANPPVILPSRDLRRTIGFWGGIGVMIGVIIGSGIFRTPSAIAAAMPSPWLILLMWLLGGLLCLAGAFTYAELAGMYPASGGVYVFIREGFGECPAFVFGWSYLVLIKPFAAGGIAFVFAENFLKLIHYSGDAESAALWTKIITTIMLLTLTLINWRGVGISTAFAGALTFVKVAALVLLVGMCIGLAKFSFGAMSAMPSDSTAPASALSVAGISTVLALVLWTYDGWADVGSIAGEVKEPQRTLPRIYIFGTLGIIGLYLAVNAVYYALVPIPELLKLVKESPTTPIAALAAERLIGPVGASVTALVVMLSTLGSSHASVMTGARVSYAQARDGLLFRFIGHVHPKFHTPDAALISQVLLSIVAVWFLGSFQSLAEAFVFTMWIFYAMAGVAIFVLRAKRPGAERPFRCPGYPIVPLVFIASAMVMTVLSVMDSPSTTLPWLAVLMLGVPVFYVWRRMFPVR